MNTVDNSEYAPIKEDQSLPLLTATTPTHDYERLEKVQQDFRRIFMTDIVIKYNTVM